MARGSVTRRSDGWCIRLDVGVDLETGKRRQVSRQGFRTKREAQAVLNDLLLQRELVATAPRLGRSATMLMPAATPAAIRDAVLPSLAAGFRLRHSA